MISEKVKKKEKILAIGYGNTLRSDDGAGQIVATTVEAWNLPFARAIAIQQLTPELAEDISQAQLVIFIDAYPVDKNAQENSLKIMRIFPNEEAGNFSAHVSDPRALLALSQTLYHHSPPAWWLLIPAVNFDFGEELSPITSQGVAEALEQIWRLLKSENFLTFEIDSRA
ncbi:MAG: hydrogenase maturation protease [Oscillatoriaceae bacterium SKW80]|nr:hydrogenase maturation protease [Oscillatoriaceae bacterium SKYG93]MCX8122490.1 hydrogenase maturation protease [Oscillatoriaceae bacterium SKW80]MDW8452592.1 hydrogenase maturation protease [Oscillatoriaceae cyanobacterium SKYGB_i_bin93]HIK27333.1 hydrogenase maturation protease [Oscillatoriaceae cyanobacterium M7585_C2015_266]